VEGDRDHYYQTPYWLLPFVEEDSITERVLGGAVFAPFSRGLLYDEEAEDILYKPFLTTSGNAFSKRELSDG